MSILVGIIIGVVLGLTGAGGSVFAVPLLIAVVGVSAYEAIGISLGAVALSACYGALSKLRTKQIQWVPALVFAGIGSLFAPLGNWMNRQLPETTLMAGFAVLVSVVAIRMWQQAKRSPEATKVLRAGKNTTTAHAAHCRLDIETPFKIGLPCIAMIILGAMLTGILSGLFGVGGGFLIVPTLLFLTAMPIAQAVATSLVVITLISFSGFLSFIFSGGTIDLHILMLVAVGGIVGMTLGVWLSRFIAGPTLQKIFAVLMLCMAGITVYSTFSA